MNTEVELAENQSFAVGGLLDNRETETLSKIPFISSVPILGKFFQSKSKNRTNTELMVIVTPYIVQPVSSAQLAMPTDGMTTPTDFDMFMRDQMLGSDSQRQPASPSSMPASRRGISICGHMSCPEKISSSCRAD